MQSESEGSKSSSRRSRSREKASTNLSSVGKPLSGSKRNSAEVFSDLTEGSETDLQLTARGEKIPYTTFFSEFTNL